MSVGAKNQTMQEFISESVSIIEKVPVLDIVLLAILVFGWKVGTKFGGNVMLPKFLKWLTVLVVASTSHVLLAGLLQKKTGLPIGTALLMTYAFVGAAIFFICLSLENRLEQVIKKSCVFGNIETIGGGVLGVLNFASAILFCMALLHGEKTTRAQAENQAKANQKEYGEAALPTIASFKFYVFEKSYLGKFTGTKLKSVLVVNEIRAVAARE